MDSERAAGAGDTDDQCRQNECEEPQFLDELPPGAPLPGFVTLVNTRELFGLKVGESLEEAIARRGL